MAVNKAYVSSLKKRGPNAKVGKRFYGVIYIHKSAVSDAINESALEKAKALLKQAAESDRADADICKRLLLNSNCYMIDNYNKIIRFDESPDFDTAREPRVGFMVRVDYQKEVVSKVFYSGSIWHHKWLWVRDDYEGFDVEESKAWSNLWTSKLKEPASGIKEMWHTQLKRFGLTEYVK